MKKITKFLLLPALALAWTACTEDEKMNAPEDKTPLAITGGTATRATGTTWHAADAIGVYMLTANTDTPADDTAPAPGYHYINQSAEGPTATFAPADERNTAYFPSDEAKVDVIAYYPWSQLTIDNGQLTINTADQSSLPAIDLMTSELSGGHSSAAPEVALSFRHRLTKVLVTITGAPGNVTSLTISGTPATATYDLMQQKITATGQATDIPLSIVNSPLSIAAIVVPTAAGSGVEFKLTADGRDYTAKLPVDAALEAGKEAQVTIKVKKDPEEVEVTFSSAEWTDAPGQADLRHDVTRGISITGVSGTGEFKLSTGGNSFVYAWDGTSLTSTAPAYWDDLESTTTHTFNGVYTPSEAGTPEKDILTGTAPDVAWGTAIDFGKMKHSNCRFTVKLTPGTGYTESDMNGASITLKGVHTADYTATRDVAAILAPLTSLTDAQAIAVTIGSNAYTIKLNTINVDAGKLMALEAGKNYMITLTVSKKELEVDIDVAPWDDVTGTGDVGY